MLTALHMYAIKANKQAKKNTKLIFWKCRIAGSYNLRNQAKREQTAITAIKYTHFFNYS
jgi:hypothetical protein